MSFSIQNRLLRQGSGFEAVFDSALFSRVDAFRFVGDAGRLESRHIAVRGSPLRIARVTSTGHRIALTEEDGLTFLVPRLGRVQVRTRLKDWESGRGSVLALRPGQRETEVKRAGAEDYLAYVLVLPRAELARCEAAGLSEELLFGGQGGALLTGEAAQRLQEYLAFAVEQLAARPVSRVSERAARGFAALALDLLIDLIEAAVAERASSASLVASDPGLRRAAMARDILVARAEEPLSIADLARELGVGLRSLQLCFMRSFGTTPRAMLTRIRLENARARLMAAGPEAQVTTIAMDAGFTHLSRFSEAYRQAFGERPVDTLQRARRH
jgi:AraC-like DNA-binding protein